MLKMKASAARLNPCAFPDFMAAKKTTSTRKAGSLKINSGTEADPVKPDGFDADAVAEIFAKMQKSRGGNDFDKAFISETENLVSKLFSLLEKVQPLLPTARDDEARLILSGFEMGEGDPAKFLGPEDTLPGDKAAARAVEYSYGHESVGLLIGFLIFQAMAGDKIPPLHQKEFPNSRFKDGLVGGVMNKQFRAAVSRADGSFFRTLADMIERDFLSPPKEGEQVARLLWAKHFLEAAGNPVTKKTVRETAAKRFVEDRYRKIGQRPTPEQIARESALLEWDWKRLWKKHPDLEALRNDPGGRPRERRKRGTK